MPVNPAEKITRSMIEQLVRESLYSRMGLAVPKPSGPPHPLVVNVSARHCHLSEEAVKALFGEGYKLAPMKDLYQEGHFAAKETVTLVGPRSRIISNLRILGPCRPHDQIELAFTDAIALGFKVPVRLSGDIKGTPGCMLMGPNGFYNMKEGVIRASPHAHLHPDDAAYYGVKNGEYMKLKIGGPLPITFDRILARLGENLKLEVHIDTDEGNACGLQPETPCELLK